MTCIKCKQPMLVGQYEVLSNDGERHRIVDKRICLDCSENMGRPKDVDLDCFDYIRPSRVGVRLRDGFAMMHGAL